MFDVIWWSMWRVNDTHIHISSVIDTSAKAIGEDDKDRNFSAIPYSQGQRFSYSFTASKLGATRLYCWWVKFVSLWFSNTINPIQWTSDKKTWTCLRLLHVISSEVQTKSWAKKEHRFQHKSVWWFWSPSVFFPFQSFLHFPISSCSWHLYIISQGKWGYVAIKSTFPLNSQSQFDRYYS